MVRCSYIDLRHSLEVFDLSLLHRELGFLTQSIRCADINLSHCLKVFDQPVLKRRFSHLCGGIRACSNRDSADEKDISHVSPRSTTCDDISKRRVANSLMQFAYPVLRSPPTARYWSRSVNEVSTET